MTPDQAAPDSRSPGQPAERAMAPIRWPHPGRATLGLVGVWVLGMLVAVFVPAVVVPPTATTAATGAVLLAFTFTLLGAAIMIATGWMMHRRHDEPLAWAFGLVPAITVVVGGIIMVAAKLAVA